MPVLRKNGIQNFSTITLSIRKMSHQHGGQLSRYWIFARFPDSGITKLNQRLKTNDQLYLNIDTNCQNMIEIECIFMMHFNIHFL